VWNININKVMIICNENDINNNNINDNEIMCVWINENV